MILMNKMNTRDHATWHLYHRGLVSQIKWVLSGALKKQFNFLFVGCCGCFWLRFNYLRPLVRGVTWKLPKEEQKHLSCQVLMACNLCGVTRLWLRGLDALQMTRAHKKELWTANASNTAALKDVSTVITTAVKYYNGILVIRISIQRFRLYCKVRK